MNTAHHLILDAITLTMLLILGGTYY